MHAIRPMFATTTKVITIAVPNACIALLRYSFHFSSKSVIVRQKRKHYQQCYPDYYHRYRTHKLFPDTVQFAVRLECSCCNNSFAFDLLIISHSCGFVKSFFSQPRKGGFPTSGVILLCFCVFTPFPPKRCIAYLLSL